jgi:hypothetical protein
MISLMTIETPKPIPLKVIRELSKASISASCAMSIDDHHHTKRRMGLGFRVTKLGLLSFFGDLSF